MADNENLIKKQKQLIYRANHRGIKEMDIILGRFANEFLQSFSASQLSEFEELATQNDRDLLCWFTGEKPVPDEFQTDLFKTILAYATKNSQENVGKQAL